MFKHLVWISAVGVALCAALFSVTGIATLFSAKFWAVVAMASALELGKLVMASYLYRWWKKTPKLLKTYAISAVAILMVITSIGIYGYLSAAYAEVAAVPQNTLNEISAIDARQASLNSTLDRLNRDNEMLDSHRIQAQASLDNILAGETELSQRSAFANLRQEIAELDEERNVNNNRIENTIAERDSLENVKVGLNAELNINSDIGPFIYVARTTDLPLDTVVKWFVLMIVFVFDPLAISLILAYNNIVMKEQEKTNVKEIKTKKLEPKIDLTRREFENAEEEKLEPPIEKMRETLSDKFFTEAIDLDLGSDWPDEDEDIFGPVDLTDEESDVIDLDALRTLESLKDIRDLSDQIQLQDEQEEQDKEKKLEKSYLFQEDPGTCPHCGEPWQWVRPGKSQPVCDCHESCPYHGPNKMVYHPPGEFENISGYFCADCERERRNMSAGSRDSAPMQSVETEEDAELLKIYDEPMDKETARIDKGWSLTTKGEFPYDMPYYQRPGYDWERRRKEWERDPQAIEYYNNHIKLLTDDDK